MAAILCIPPVAAKKTAPNSPVIIHGGDPVCSHEKLFTPSRIEGSFPLLRYPVDTTNISAPENQYAIDGRVLYRFSITQPLFVKLCNLNVSPTNPTRVNLVSTPFLSQTNSGDILVSTVVGYDNARNVLGRGAGTVDGLYSPYQSNDLQNAQFEQNLKALNIKYSKHAVLQIFNWQIDFNTPNGSLTPLSILLNAGFEILSYIEGESGYRLPLQNKFCADSMSVQTLTCGPDGNLGLASIFIELPVCDLQRAIDQLAAFVPDPLVSDMEHNGNL